MAELSTLARPYAKAAFEFARAGDALDNWSVMLGFAAAITADDKVSALLEDPSLTQQQKADRVIGLCTGEMADHGENFIRILAENNRLALLPEIAGLFDQLKGSLEQSVDVNVSSAFELDDAQKQMLADTLGKMLSRKVSLSVEQDKSLIGGVVVRAGDLVIDNSVRGRLAKLAEAIGS